MVPRRGTETFISTIGHLDGRINLLFEEKMDKGTTDSVSEERGFGLEMGNRTLVDLCVMASKLSYENEKVIQNIVLRHWKASYFIASHFLFMCHLRVKRLPISASGYIHDNISNFDC